MPQNKDGRPEWFKIWRRNRREIDTDILSLESRGIIFTNALRFFDTGEEELLPMTELEKAMFNVVKINIEDSYTEYDAKSETYRSNANKRWEKQHANVSDCMQLHPIATEGRSQKEEVISNRVFNPPTLEEVKAYCQKRGNNVNPKKFYDYYNDGVPPWTDKDGKPLKNWKRKMIMVWEKDEPEAQNSDHNWRENNRYHVPDEGRQSDG